MNERRAPEIRLERTAAPADGVAVIELAGELDLAVSGRFRALLDELVDERPSLTVVDITELVFMDSTILRELLRAHQALQEAGARLVVAGAQPGVRRLLDLTGTSAVFELASSRDEALGS